MISSASPVAVTGATGFIGRRFCARLKSETRAVRALARAPQRAEPGIEWIAGDLADRAALERLVADAPVVVHLAGAVRGATAADFQRPNVDGVQNLLAALAAVNPSARVLHVSTLAAREPQLSFYAASKRAGEALVLGGRIRAAVLRPPAVYGPGDRELLPLLMGLYRGRGVIPRHAGRFSLICVDDLVDALLALMAHPDADGDTYEVHDGKPGGYVWNEVIDAVNDLRGSAGFVVRVPQAVLAGVAWVGSTVQRAIGHAPMLTPGKVRELFHPDWVCSNEAFTARTGWVPQVDLAAGLRLTLGAASAVPAAA